MSKFLTCAFLLGGLLLNQADEKKVEAWKKALEKNPDDSEAAFQYGKYLCFTKADWDAGLPLLAKGKDKTLAELAQMELGTMDLPSGKDSPLTGAVVDFGEQAAPDLIRGDALWDLMKKYKDAELRNIMNRALWRYKQALLKVDEPRKRKLLERMAKAMDRFRAMYTHPGKVIDATPKGWGVVIGKGEKVEGSATDETRSRTGRASMRITPAKTGLLVTERRSLLPGDYILSFWYLAEGTIAPDLFHVMLYDKSDQCVDVRPPMPPDRGELPIWIHVEQKVKSSQDTLFFRLYIDNVTMREGTVWIDDLSFRNGKGEEFVINGGFEDK